jgi:hypothetical protein
VGHGTRGNVAAGRERRQREIAGGAEGLFA